MEPIVYPDIWGQGSLFAFSGLDGMNTYKGSLVGTLCAERLGVVFHTKEKRTLHFKLKGLHDIHYKVVASDLIHAQLYDSSAEAGTDLYVLFHSQDTVIGKTAACAAPAVYSWDKEGNVENDGVVYESEGEFTAFYKQTESGVIRFAFAYSSISAQDAANKAKLGLSADFNKAVEDKLSFYNSLPRIRADRGIAKTLNKCFSVMKTQVYTPEGRFVGRWTTPDRLPHAKLWLWDSVFHALGNRYLSADLAYESIEAVLATIRDDGFIPHMSTPDVSSDVTQPPVLAWGLYRLFEFAPDKRRLEASYPKLKAYLLWNMKHRDVNRNFLYEWYVQTDSVNCRCDECGMDNSPRFDHVNQMDAIDFSCFMANEARYMARIASLLELREDEGYWNDLHALIKTNINEQLWDEADEFYYDKIVADGQFRKVKAVSSFLPLFAGVCDQDRADRLVRHLQDSRSFHTQFGVPSIAVDDPTFGTDMWRGPVWINYNYMIAAGLQEYGYEREARELIDKTLAAISFWYHHDGAIYEFYDSMDRVSPSRLKRKGHVIEPYDFDIRLQSIRDYGWSCTLFAAMAMETYGLETALREPNYIKQKAGYPR
ncbi:trehalase family glycosidase [Paenibacillus oryzisoli]|uniref:amylo-alpha-1,6-glucosidase n=1 Tax=Paenibacillus oryzisoli TaxID=1850517 RepID=UPI003D2ACFAA